MRIIHTFNSRASEELTAHNRSYEAAEENEISFLEGEHIVEIEAISDDWWQGKTADGRVGLFPGKFALTFALVLFTEVLVCVANYVEMSQ